MKEYAKQFYKGKAWKVCRESYIAKRNSIDGGLCERCKENPGYIVHHKIYITPQNIKDPDVTLNHCNLEYVCKKCHDNEHYEDMHNTSNRPYVMFGADGKIIPIDSR